MCPIAFFTFKNVIHVLDPRYTVPSHNTLSREIEKLNDHMTSAIKFHLLSAIAINFTTNIWSKRGLTTSYLGVTAHFFHSLKMNITLSCSP